MFAERLFSSPAVTVREVACDASRGGDQGDEYNEAPCIAIPLRGCYAVERGGQTIVADANTAVLFDAESPYRVSHPADDGDVTFAITGETAAMADAFGHARERDAGRRPFRATHSALDPALHLRVRLLRHRLAAADVDALEVEEALFAIVTEIAGTSRTEISRTGVAAVERAKAFLAQHFRDRVLLSDIALASGTSPFYLARAFPAATGMTLHRYLVALRHAAALDAIAAGASDLARVAVDAGFAHHSHLTKTLARAYGATPRELRTILTR